MKENKKTMRQCNISKPKIGRLSKQFIGIQSLSVRVEIEVMFKFCLFCIKLPYERYNTSYYLRHES